MFRRFVDMLKYRMHRKYHRRIILCLIIVALAVVVLIFRGMPNRECWLEDDPFRRNSYSEKCALPTVEILNSKFEQRSFAAAPAGPAMTRVATFCRLPRLAIDDPKLMPFFHTPEPLNCGHEPNWVYVAHGKEFMIDEEARKRHGNITCSYEHIWRVSDFRTASKVYEKFVSGNSLIGDFFRATCKASDGAVYSNLHAGVVPVPGRASASVKSPDSSSEVESLGLNVYMAGFDSLSRMTFQRKLPKTYEFLTTELDSTVLEGYNIVGDGTPQALIPILTGKTELELPLTRKRFANANFVNVYPFVWNQFSKAGYQTMFGEDCSSVGTFTYRLKGFRKQPTDHYLRTFYLKVDAEANWANRFCIGGEPHHRVHFRYAENFFEAYSPEVKKFAFLFHGMLSHDDINKVQVADEDMVKHLKFFHDNGHLNNTMLIFMSDHGHRFAELRATEQGKLEERLPFFSIYLPPWFGKRYPEAMRNLRLNARRLTTPFDIHETLTSVLRFRTPKKGNLSERAISLFDEVPLERTCSDAGIEPHWCACLSWQTLPTTVSEVKYIANAIVAALNKVTASERQLCSKLRLRSIVKAFLLSANDAVIKYKQAKDADGFVPDLSDVNTAISRLYYQVNLVTTPGNALYEASVVWDKSINRLYIDLNTVSHINAYGDLPHCIIDKDYFLAKWCVCYDKI